MRTAVLDLGSRQIPLLYERGKPEAVQMEFRMEQGVHDRLASTIHTLAGRCPWGYPTALVTAGAFVQKPGPHGRGEGAAFDLDAIHWDEGVWRAVPWQSSGGDPTTSPEFYLAVQAVCHMYWGVVLSALYNRAHEDHLHLDWTRTVGWSTRKSIVTFLQASLNLVHDIEVPVEVDGIWGPNTANALRSLQPLGLVEMGAVTDKGWAEYLDFTARRGFNQALATDAQDEDERKLTEALEKLEAGLGLLRQALEDRVNRGAAEHT